MLMPDLPLCRYRAVFQAEDAVHLPRFAGSAWRGVFGWALKRTVCVTRQPSCDDCMLLSACVYPTLFETRPAASAAKMSRYTRVPLPFVLAPEPTPPFRERGAELQLDVCLIGHANRQVAYVIRALETGAARGLGPGRGRLRLRHVQSIGMPEREAKVCYEPGGLPDWPMPQSPPVPAAPATAEVTFLTPLRLKRDGDLMTPASFDAGALLMNLVRRISMLSYFHTDTPLEADFRALKAAAGRVTVQDHDLHWRETTRYSGRQKTTMQMGGLLGRAVLDLGAAPELWPYLWLGQWVHAGKGTTMGFGALRVGGNAPPAAVGGA